MTDPACFERDCLARTLRPPGEYVAGTGTDAALTERSFLVNPHRLRFKPQKLKDQDMSKDSALL